MPTRLRPSIATSLNARFGVEEYGQSTDKDQLLATIMAGLPGAYERYDVPRLRRVLERFEGMTHDELRRNYSAYQDYVKRF